MIKSPWVPLQSQGLSVFWGILLQIYNFQRHDNGPVLKFVAHMKTEIYFDHNATTRPAPEVREQILDWIEAWGNPSSVHQFGRGPKSLMRWSRVQVGSMIGADPLEVIFTSGGSEGNNTVIKGVFFRRVLQRNHFLVSSVEHPSVLKAFEFLKSQGAEVETIAVDRNGTIDLERFEKQVRDDTCLVSVMLANNETGTVFPIKKMAKIAHKKGALFHSDAVQALGKMLFDVKDLDVDFATFSAHKFYGLKGCGVLYIKRGGQIVSLVHGGGHERGRRAGTENVLGIASLAAMSARMRLVESKIQEIAKLRDLMETRILDLIPQVSITAKESKRICNTSSMVLSDVDGEVLLMNLDMEGVAVSTGAACSSGAQEPSRALQAMGLSREEAQSSLRVSLGWNSTEEEVLRFVEILKRVVERVRGLSLSRASSVEMQL